MSEITDFLHTDDRVLWLLIGVSIAMLFTLQAVEAAVEGAWPHQRRPTRMTPRERSAHWIWGVVAVLVLPGALLEMLILSVRAWRNLDHTQTQVLGSVFIGIGWALFLLVSQDWLPFRRYLARIGPVAPLAVILMLVIGNILLVTAFVDIRPTIDDVRNALPSLFITRS